MKNFKYISIVAFTILLFGSCEKKIEDYQSDPNKPTSVPPSLVLGTVLNDINGTGSAGALGGINSWGTVHQWNQYDCNNYDYYGNNMYSWTNGSFDPYLVLKNVLQMENEVLTRGGDPVNPYEAVGRFIRAYYYYNLTSLFGDVPLTNALQAPQNSNPAYTPQEQVFEYILNELDTANTHLSGLIASGDNSLSSSQDIYYGGNLSSWQKVVNSFKLRVLISLSDKAGDAMLNVPAQFANIINNPGIYPIFTSQNDDLKFVYNPGGSNSYSTYPFNPSNFGSIAQRYNMASTYVSALTGLNDARVFITCEPAWALVGADTANAAQYKYFAGASTGLSLAIMYPNASANLYSFINRHRYFSNFTGEPNVLAGYKEMLFNIAEAIERGWVTGNAETYYKTGITESMKFYGIDITQINFTAFFLPPTKNSVTQVQPYHFMFDFPSYYAQPDVALSPSSAMAINQIVLQKYIVMFENSGYEAYFNYRRTGVPAFQSGTGVGNNGIIPKRWAYPVSEQTQNTQNWMDALANQGFSADDLNQTMWLIK